MKLSTWAKKEGVCYRTAWNWFKSGTLPVKAEQTPTGTILIKENKSTLNEERIIIYCRVSNHSRREELSFQVQRCEEFCLVNGWSVDRVYKEIASGLNDNRKEFWKALDSNPSKIIVENKDRLTRFGFNYLDKLLKERGTQIIVIHQDKEDEADLLKDIISILYSFCARLYGLRRAYVKVKKCELIIKAE